MNKSANRRRAITAAFLCIIATLAGRAQAKGADIWKNIEIPEYPNIAFHAGIEGQVLVDFRVDERGRLVDPTIVSAAPRKVFDAAVLDALKRMRIDMAEVQRANKPLPHSLGYTFQMDPCAVSSGGPFYLGENNSTATGFAIVSTCAGTAQVIHAQESFVDAVIEEQKHWPGYVAAVHDVEALESTLTSERTEARPPGVNRGLKTLWLKPVVSPSFRQRGKGGGAVIKFSVTGAGRAKNVEIMNGSDPALSAALTRAVSLWLFEPATEGTVGVTRTGYEAALLVGYRNFKTQVCSEPQLSGPVDFEVHLCF